MNKSTATIINGIPSSRDLPTMLNGLMNPAYFKQLQENYRKSTGYSLVLADPNGSIQMGLPDCEEFPCTTSCRECREHIVIEALRTGKVCIDTCHEDYTIWGLPIACRGEVVGGLVVIGGEHKSTRDDIRFKAACRELYRLSRDHGLLPESYVFIEEDFSEIHRFVFRSKFQELHDRLGQHQRRFLIQLQTAEFVDAERHLRGIQDCFTDTDELPIDVLRGLVGDLVFETRKQFCQAGMDAYACTAEAGALIEQLNDVTDIDGIRRVLDTFFERFRMLSRQRPKNQDDLIIERATTYLEEHLRENLTREMVAKAVGVSSSHFSRLIREKKGRTFTDLLNQYRIERASKLLVRTSFTLAHIANEAGFCDQSYFSKVFRRYKDMSPAQYRAVHNS